MIPYYDAENFVLCSPLDEKEQRYFEALAADTEGYGEWVVQDAKKMLHMNESLKYLECLVVKLADRCEQAEKESLEQARLNGMGSEREARLMALLENAERTIERIHEKVKSL